LIKGTPFEGRYIHQSIYQKFMKEKIEMCLMYLSKLTKDEANFIEDVIKWDEELKSAFLFAKNIFEEQKNE
jgi:hypothetical protein